jgi:putative ABC transport system ATP-binding protein
MKGLSGDKMTVFRRNHIGFVLQHFALIPGYTIYDNIAFPLRLRHESKQDIKKKVKNIAEQLEIKKHLGKYPKELSGGEAQRAAIARAVVHGPELILADEPTGALDEETGLKIMDIFKQLNQQGNTMVIVTHDANVAGMCTRTVRIKDGKNI